MIEKKESIVVIKKVLAGALYQKEIDLNEYACRVKKITVTFAEGQDGSLKVKPWALNGYQTPVDLYRGVEDEYLSGNNSVVEVDVDVYLNNNAKLMVSAINEGDFDYTVNVVFEVEFEKRVMI